MPSEVRPPTQAELPEYMGCLRTSFLIEREISEEEVEFKAAHTDMSRLFPAFSDGVLCGTSRTFATDLTVPGGAIPVAAVTEVSVLPTHRREGHLSRMMAAMLADAREREELAAILIASEWPIYGRFGYGPASDRMTYEVKKSAARFRGNRVGSVEIVDVATIRELAPQVYEKIRLDTVGALDRDEDWWDLILNVAMRPGAPALKNRVRVVWRDDDGELCGYAIYDATAAWEDSIPAGEINLREIFASTPVAYRELWRYLCSVDLASTIHAFDRPTDDTLPFHLLDGRQVRVRGRFDHLWVCLLDVTAALGARSYAGVPGALVVEVNDPYNSTTTKVAVEGDGEASHVEVTDRAADIVLDVAALGAAYLGGTSFAALAAAGYVTDLTGNGVERADKMFSVKPLPYLTTNF